ncbi:hypothetical protein LAV78_01030 [Brucella intermedia]|uniref:hypothetical protein n=1 Tax=Brucella intermedia TaxID=94625 RepID=UPI001E3B920A|nr:hypothetical protein [Brucella intermedia]MCB4917108.1 hypothetical protein [Brucella intermedia]
MTSINKKLVAEVFGQSVQDGQAIARTIQGAADDLAFLMGQLHGETFRAHVSCEPAFVFIRYSDMGGEA